ncbi:hypothetical protein MTO96_041026 [Rhipicephalus appendiculatus]
MHCASFLGPGVDDDCDDPWDDSGEQGRVDVDELRWLAERERHRDLERDFDRDLDRDLRRAGAGAAGLFLLLRLAERRE